MINGFSIVNFFLTILKLIEWSIFIRVILSFVHISRDNALVDSIYLITDYIMYPAKILLGMFGLDRGIIDWSPLITLIFLQIIGSLIVGLV
ncbi:MAG: YggT family protein [Finegoldia magna]|uniref:YggT family protein n=1 Tax=Finegoldia magna TaxID=1260 RepID=UPI001CE0F230|nr:YggT family protein [Finegoldia magna]MCA5587855.1 YggT family protein [Finegoldia magna]MDU2575625.1 YggT family protein [Finegoldia magna]MDU7479345.1 YggT family protein [Finegoldia magna]